MNVPEIWLVLTCYNRLRSSWLKSLCIARLVIKCKSILNTKTNPHIMRKKHEIIFDFIPMSSCTAAWNLFTFMILDFSSFVSIENHKRTNIQEPIEWFVLMVSSIACRFHKFLHVWQLCWLVNKGRIVKSSVFDSNWGNMKHLRGPRGVGTNIDYVMQLYTIAQRNSQFFYIYHTNLKSCLGVTLVCRLWPSYNCVNACSLLRLPIILTDLGARDYAHLN